MNDLWECFGKVVKTNKLQFCQDGKYILKGAEKTDKYRTTVLSKNNDNLVVFNVGKNSHASFVSDGYNSNCDYIFIQVNDNEINFILCELKKSDSNKNRAKSFKQLKYSIPLMHYLRQLLVTHCEERLEHLKISFKKVLLIKNDVSKTNHEK